MGRPLTKLVFGRGQGDEDGIDNMANLFPSQARQEVVPEVSLDPLDLVGVDAALESLGQSGIGGGNELRLCADLDGA